MSRDEAYLKVHRLIRYYANRFALSTRADRDDVFQEFAAFFLARFQQFDGDERHLSTFVKWMCLNAGRAIRIRETGKASPLPEYDIFASNEARPDSVAEDTEMAERVRAAVAALPEGARELVSRRFGLDGNAPAKLAELAQSEGVTVWGASCRVRSALNRLRFSLASAVEPGTTMARGIS